MPHPQSLDGPDEAPHDASTAQTGSLRGRVALLTGAAGDLVSGIAGALAARGAIVFCADIRSTADLVGTLPHSRGRELALDVTDPGEVDRVFGQALAACTFDAPTHVLVGTISRRDQEELGRANPGLVFAGGGFPDPRRGSARGRDRGERGERRRGRRVRPRSARAGFDFEFGEQTGREEDGDG